MGRGPPDDRSMGGCKGLVAATGPFRVVRGSVRKARMQTAHATEIEDVLREAGTTAPFGRLLAMSGRIRTGHAAAPGHAFAAAVMAGSDPS